MSKKLKKKKNSRCVWETLTLSFKLIQHAAPPSYPRSQSSVHRGCIWGNPVPSRSMWRRSRKFLHLDIRRDNMGWNGQDGMLGDPGSVFRSERAAAEKKGKKGRERGVQRPQYSP